jgi:hypothetical protein
MTDLGRILTAAMFAFHVIVGCCAHHAHACDERDASHLSHAVEVAEVHGFEGFCLGNLVDHVEHGPNDCHGSQCEFVRPTTHAAIPSHLQFGYAPVLPLPSYQQLCAGEFSLAQHCFPAGRLLMPVPLHLANQVLLI